MECVFVAIADGDREVGFMRALFEVEFGEGFRLGLKTDDVGMAALQKRIVIGFAVDGIGADVDDFDFDVGLEDGVEGGNHGGIE
jgi:hypothetical protein